MLVITMPTSPPGKGQALPSVLDESNAVLESAASVPLTTTALNLPSVSSVIQNMAINNLVHFACHGRPDPKNPLQSHLVLDDGDLSVADIARSLAAEADLVYLSACSTADREDGTLVDEGIHVASSFQLAGFRNVIGTLWETVDWACSEVAEEFYRSLFANDTTGLTWDGRWRFSRALHSAVTSLRVNDPDLPLLWAPFVHFGRE
jgi:CHAT domain-containing protein